VADGATPAVIVDSIAAILHHGSPRFRIREVLKVDTRTMIFSSKIRE